VTFYATNLTTSRDNDILASLELNTSELRQIKKENEEGKKEEAVASREINASEFPQIIEIIEVGKKKEAQKMVYGIELIETKWIKCWAIFSISALAIYVWSIYLGHHTKGQTCSGYNFPLWLTVYGSFSIVQLVLSTGERVFRRIDPESFVRPVLAKSDGLLIFALAWLIYGWWLVKGPDYYYPSCNYILFYTTYWIVLGTWIFILLIVAIVLCLILITSQMR